MPFSNPEDNRAWGRRRYRRVTAGRAALGLCPRCGHRPPEPGRRLCADCGEQRRRADRDRYARARAEGRLYGGKAAEAKRRAGRANTKRRYDARRAAGLCTRCGRHEPVQGGVACKGCRDRRRIREHDIWSERRAEGLCGACGAPAPDGGARCGPCTALQTGRPSRKEYGRKIYARRRARNRCTDCGAWSAGAARCPECAWRSHARSSEHRGLPAWPARYTVIAIATGEDLGTFESAAEVAGCLAFSKLAADDVEIVSDTSEMARYAAWT